MGYWSLSALLLIIVKVYYNYVIIVVKIITGIQEPKQLTTFLGSLFRQPITSHRFWFVQKKSLAASFGSKENHIRYLILHIHYIFFIIY
jgi:hypothetical protein